MEKKHYGRREDPTPILCARCGWKGRVKDSVHTYHGFVVGVDGDGNVEEDVEAVDECPGCGSDQLIESET